MNTWVEFRGTRGDVEAVALGMLVGLFIIAGIVGVVALVALRRKRRNKW